MSPPRLRTNTRAAPPDEAASPRERQERGVQLGRQPQRHPAAPVARNLRPRPVGGQRDRLRQVLQRLAPERKLARYRALRIGSAMELCRHLHAACGESERLVELAREPQHEDGPRERELGGAAFRSQRRLGFLQRLPREELRLLEVAALEMRIRLLVEHAPLRLATAHARGSEGEDERQKHREARPATRCAVTHRRKAA